MCRIAADLVTPANDLPNPRIRLNEFADSLPSK
jgi:hypothetical protein